jgi:hypothetical protein
LSDADLALIGTAQPDLPVEIGAEILEVLAALEDKLDDLAEAGLLAFRFARHFLPVLDVLPRALAVTGAAVP